MPMPPELMELYTLYQQELETSSKNEKETKLISDLNIMMRVNRKILFMLLLKTFIYKISKLQLYLNYFLIIFRHQAWFRWEVLNLMIVDHQLIDYPQLYKKRKHRIHLVSSYSYIIYGFVYGRFPLTSTHFII